MKKEDTTDRSCQKEFGQTKNELLIALTDQGKCVLACTDIKPKRGEGRQDQSMTSPHYFA